MVTKGRNIQEMVNTYREYSRGEITYTQVVERHGRSQSDKPSDHQVSRSDASSKKSEGRS